MKSFIAHLVFLVAAVTSATRATESVDVVSPDHRWKITVESSPHLSIQLRDSSDHAWVRQEIGLKLADGRGLEGGAPTRVENRSSDTVVTPVAPVKFAQIRDQFNETSLEFSNGFSLIVRAYDNGFAYRFVTKIEGQIVVASEKRQSTFPGDPIVYFGTDKDFYSHTEPAFDKKTLSAFSPGALASLPLLVKSVNSGPALLFSETALEDYPGQWIHVGAESKSLDGVWPGYPTREEETSLRDIVVRERETNLAHTTGTRSFPWRFVAVAPTDADLLINQLAYLLAEPSRVTDTSWIKPGKAQWDWWHDFNVYDVDFRGGISQALYRHYIEFAAAHRLSYIILDEGWYANGDLTKTAHDIDIPSLVAYGRTKGIRVILWTSWSLLRKQFDVALPLFEQWGIAGIKVDFFQRDDQIAVEFYWKLSARERNANCSSITTAPISQQA